MFAYKKLGENIIAVKYCLIKNVKNEIFTYSKIRDHTNRQYIRMKGN